MSKLATGLKAWYEDDIYTEDGELIESKIIDLGLTIDEFNLCIDWYHANQQLHANDSVLYGCDCGCGGDSLNLELEAELEQEALDEMESIEKLLGEPPEEYL